MPFIPHTEQEIKEMLAEIGIADIETLFDEIPDSLRHANLAEVPAAISAIDLTRLMQTRAQLDDNLHCFIGAGAYEHYIPPTVWEIATRGEFMTAYTPYQAEASQGSLQLIYEFQTMIASLMGLEVANASLYDGASSLAEAILMAVRLTRNKEQMHILMPRNVHPLYRQTVKTVVNQQGIQLIEIPYVKATGKIDIAALDKYYTPQVAALVIPQPNFFGGLEDVDALVEWARAKQIVTIAQVNPMSMALLKPPGQWGASGVDIACGEGQPLGIPLASGGPYYGFLCSKLSHVRQMPGRIVGQTVDLNGKTGYVLTLQAREQHIRRAKATSNICTNQGLMVTASTIYMSLLGPFGLRRLSMYCHQQATLLRKSLLAIKGVTEVFNAPYFNEIVLRLEVPVAHVLHELSKRRIQAGFALGEAYPELSDCLLICATETKCAADIQYFAQELTQVLTEAKNKILTSANGG